MSDGYGSDVQTALAQIEFCGTAALANDVGHSRTLRSEALGNVNPVATSHAGSCHGTLGNDAAFRDGRAVKLAINDHKQSIVKAKAFGFCRQQVRQVRHINLAAVNSNAHRGERGDKRHRNEKEPEHHQSEEGLHEAGLIVTRQDVDNSQPSLDTGDKVGTTTDKTELLRKLPSVDALLRWPAIEALVVREGPSAVADAARAVLARIREEMLAARLDSSGVALAVSGLAEAIERQTRASLAYSLRPVINATGVILHTNLGRAPLGEKAFEHIREVVMSYSNLEFNTEAGERGKRDVHVDRLFARLLGEIGRDISTVVVNNNAAAVLIALNTLAEGGEVIVSRGELVEIGGSFRVPDVMAKSGATLREVGTTNRTRASDYENAINEKTKLLMRVHRSNFEMVGFTEQPSLGELVKIGRKHRLPVLEDVGSGAFFDLRNVNVHDEPTIHDSIRAGVDVVTYSGDKLLGGPQAGIISGSREMVTKIRKNPLFRALRVDKLTYGALEATMLAYIKQDHDAIPAIRMMRITTEDLGSRAEAIRENISSAQLTAEIVDSESVIGGGAAPTATLPTKALAITSAELSADEIAERLRRHDPPIVARVEEDRVLLDLRTVFPAQDEVVARALLAVKK